MLQVVRPVVREVKKDGSVPLWRVLTCCGAHYSTCSEKRTSPNTRHQLNEREMRAVTREIALHIAGQPLPDDQYAQNERFREPLSAGYARRDEAARSRRT